MGGVSFCKRVLLFSWRVRGMSTTAGRLPHVSRTYSDASKIISACLSVVSPPELISNSLSFDADSGTLSVAGRKYHVKNNVKVVGFGKAVLGMASAVERLLGQHITEGVVSIPTGAVEVAREHYPHHLLQPNSRIRIYEGAGNNLPDSSSEAAAREVLDVARGCGQDDILIALVSGGGSALLPCPVEGITVQEKRQLTEGLSRGGASIQEINTVRKAISLTKGGRLAQAASTAQVLGLILSDVIGDPLDDIASGPTVPQKIDNAAALSILEKYGVQDTHPSVTSYLNSQPLQQELTGIGERVFNLIVGNNDIATRAAKTAAMELGYTCYVWSRQLQGEASLLGELYATVSRYLVLSRRSAGTEDWRAARDTLHTQCGELSQGEPALEPDVSNLLRTLDMVGPEGTEKGFCLIGAGEPTVTVRGRGRGGRNQELALTYAVKSHQLGQSSGPTSSPRDGDGCVFASLGTDGQDGPCEAAGAMVDHSLCATALEQGLQPLQSLFNNDSYGFFSALNAGRNLLRTGLTGTNVMDIHLLLVK